MTPFLKLLRPHQWVKNAMVLTGLLFSHAWREPAMVRSAALATLAFCLVSSFVYVMNDVADRERDRLHPVKRGRPVASGAIGLSAAWILALLAGALGAMCGYFASPQVLAILCGYVVLNVGYSAGLKNIVLLDVFIIAAGFMLRVFAGTWAIGIPPSQWLILCATMLALFFGFAKRRAELQADHRHDHNQRQVLSEYSTTMLDQFMTITGTGVVLTYALYTVSPSTIALHKTEHLIYSAPLVIYGVLRTIFLLQQRGEGENPVRDFLLDPHVIVTFIAWVAFTAYLISGA